MKKTILLTSLFLAISSLCACTPNKLNPSGPDNPGEGEDDPEVAIDDERATVIKDYPNGDSVEDAYEVNVRNIYKDRVPSWKISPYIYGSSFENLGLRLGW